jgi:methionyl-tRNA synthetase
VDDLDLSFEDFVNRVNADLLNKIVNLASRTIKFITKFFDGEVAEFDPSEFPVVASAHAHLERANVGYEGWNFRDAVREIVDASVELNEFYQASEPWALRKTDEAKARRVCAAALHGTTAIMHALLPVVPKLVQRYATCLGLEDLTAEHSVASWRPAKVTDPAEHLLTRIDMSAVDALVEDSTITDTPDHSLAVTDFGDEITFDDFAKVDLRIGVIEAATTVEKADKLLQLTVHCGKRINVFAGVRSAYPDPSVLVGKRVVVVANLKPRKMRFGVSEGMLLAMSGPDDDGLQLVNPDDSAKGGWTVR